MDSISPSATPSIVVVEDDAKLPKDVSHALTRAGDEAVLASSAKGGVQSDGGRPGTAETGKSDRRPDYAGEQLRIPGMNDPKRMDVIGLLGPLRRYARSLTRDETQAEDLVQDTLVRAYERHGSFRSGGNLRGWLLSILHNTFIDGRRRHTAAARRLEQAAAVAETAGPAAQESHVRLQQVHAAFLHLPDEQRAALHLVAIEGLPYQEAADALGIPVGTLMSRLGRARATLRGFEAGTHLALPSESKRPRLRIIGGADV